MTTKYTLSTLIIFVMTSLPAVSLANTYQYFDTAGQLRSIQADSSSIALLTAPNLGLYSGVFLVQSDYNLGQTGYSYTPAPTTPTNTSTIIFGKYPAVT